jgi:hypothetical protein
MVGLVDLNVFAPDIEEARISLGRSLLLPWGELGTSKLVPNGKAPLSFHS